MATKAKKLTLLAVTAAVALLLVTAGVYWDDILVWYRFTRDFERLAANEQGYPEYRHRQTGIVFVRMPGGTFLMGSPDGEKGRRSDEIQHEVLLSPFLVAKYEVAHAQWKLIVGKPARVNFFPSETDRHPVRNVSWSDCQHFCEKTGLSLPTEAQWEYACRAGSQRPYGGTAKLDEMGWYKANSRLQTHPVGLKKPNTFGLFDMHGNVSEWCADAKDSTFYSRPEATGPDPVCSTSDTNRLRVNRGGCYAFDGMSCRAASRNADGPEDAESDHGFRPVYILTAR